MDGDHVRHYAPTVPVHSEHDQDIGRTNRRCSTSSCTSEENDSNCFVASPQSRSTSCEGIDGFISITIVALLCVCGFNLRTWQLKFAVGL